VCMRVRRQNRRRDYASPVCLYRPQESKPGVNKYRAPGHHGDRNFYTIEPNICGSAVCSLLHIKPPGACNFVVTRRFFLNLYNIGLN